MSEIRPLDAPAALSEAVLRQCLATFPYVRLTVTGSCMQPALAPGDVAIVASSARRPPRIGDVVLVRHDEGLRLHRLVLRLGSTWRTKGDDGPQLDRGVGAEDILGTVVALEGRGKRTSGSGRLWPTACSLFLALRTRFRQLVPGDGRA